jgi:polyphosphate kinase
MPRNFFRRIELMFPVEDPRLKTRVTDEILRILRSDNVKARQLQPDGSYLRASARDGEASMRSQVVFQTLARGSARESGEHHFQFIAPPEVREAEPSPNGSERSPEGAVLPRRRKARVRIAREPGGTPT